MIASASLPVRGWPRPSGRALLLLLAWGLLGLAAASGLLPALAWQVAGVVIVLLLALDAHALRRLPTPGARRSMPHTLAIGIEREVALELDPGDRAQRVRVHDLHPGGWQMHALPQQLDLAADTLSTLRYRLRPLARGAFVFEGVQLLLASPWRLWWQSRITGSREQVRVFPNFAPLARFALLTSERTMRMLGAHLARKRGDGTDFQELREYRQGDALRQIDWKATARAHRLISRQYQIERHQQIVLMVDTGRRMLARDGALAHFDQALDAALVLAYLALRQGDAVGLHASGGERRWVPPQRGMASLDVLLHASHDLQAQSVATDYLAAANELSLLQHRRSLLLWVTNVRDEDTEELLAAVRMLHKRHLVVVASLRESAIDAAMDAEVATVSDAVHVGAAARYLEQRAAVHERLRAHRVTVLDVTCDELPAALVQEYLAIKRRGAL